LGGGKGPRARKEKRGSFHFKLISPFSRVQKGRCPFGGKKKGGLAFSVKGGRKKGRRPALPGGKK